MRSAKLALLLFAAGLVGACLAWIEMMTTRLQRFEKTVEIQQLDAVIASFYEMPAETVEILESVLQKSFVRQLRHHLRGLFKEFMDSSRNSNLGSDWIFKLDNGEVVDFSRVDLREGVHEVIDDLSLTALVRLGCVLRSIGKPMPGVLAKPVLARIVAEGEGCEMLPR